MLSGAYGDADSFTEDAPTGVGVAPADARAWSHRPVARNPGLGVPTRARAQSGEDVFAGVDLLLRASGEEASSRLAVGAARSHLVDDLDLRDDSGDSDPPRVGSAHIPVAPPDIGITAESDLQSLMPYPAWRVSFPAAGGGGDARRVWGGMFPLEGVAANDAGCDLFNVAAEDLPYLARRAQSIAWLHPDDVRDRAVAAAEVQRLRRHYYEWSGRYIRVVPSSARGSASPTFQLFYAVERIFVSYHPRTETAALPGGSGELNSTRQVLSVFSLVQDAEAALPPEVYERAARAVRAMPLGLDGERGAEPWQRPAGGAHSRGGERGSRASRARSSMTDGDSSPLPLAAASSSGAHRSALPVALVHGGGRAASSSSSSSVGLGLGSAWSSSGAKGPGGSQHLLQAGMPASHPPAQQQQRLPPQSRSYSGGGRASREDSDVERLLNPGAPSQWSLLDAAGFLAPPVGGAGAGPAGLPAQNAAPFPPSGGASGSGGGRYSFSEVLRGLSGDWTVDAAPGGAAAAAPSASGAPRRPSGARDSFGLGLLMADDAPGPPAAAVRSTSGSGAPHGYGGSFSSSVLSPSATGGALPLHGSFGAIASDPLSSSPPASVGLLGGPPRPAGAPVAGLLAGPSWATDLATRAALVAVGGSAALSDPHKDVGGGVSLGARGLSDGSGISVGGALGGADVDAPGGRLWGEDTADGGDSGFVGGDRDGLRSSRGGSADFTYGFPSLGLGGGRGGSDGLGTPSSTA